MLYYYFKLNDYFDTTQKYFYFLDGLFKSCDRNKKDILDELLIPDSTYRTNRLKLKARNSWTYLPIVEFFGYNPIDSSKQKQYELCLARIYHSIYFKEPNILQKLLVELNGYIDEHNYLEPIFVLFRCHVIINLTSAYSNAMDMIRNDLEYLSLFKKNYFTSELQFFYMVLSMYAGEKVNEIDLEIYASKHKELLWLYYYLRGSYNYLNKNDVGALNYYEFAAEIFLKDYNIDRYCTVSNNISFIYNTLGKYALSLDNSSKMISYAFSSVEANRRSRFAAKHYLFACFMLDRYEEIIQFFDFIEDLEVLDDMYIFLGVYVYNKMDISCKYPKIFEERLANNDALRFLIDMIKTKKVDWKVFYNAFKMNYWLKIANKIEVDIRKM